MSALSSFPEPKREEEARSVSALRELLETLTTSPYNQVPVCLWALFMQEKSKRLLKLLVKLALTGLLLWLVLSRIDTTGLVNAFATADWRYVALSWVIGIATCWVRAARLRLLLKAQDCDVSTGKIFGASTITALYSLVLPGMVSVGIKWYILRSATGKAVQVLSAMVYNQAGEIFVRIVLSLILVALTNPVGLWWVPGVCLGGAAVTIAGLVLLLHPATSVILTRVSDGLFKSFPKLIRDAVAKTVKTSQVFAACSWAFHGRIAAINIFSTLLSALLYWCVGQAAGISVPLTAFIWQASVVFVLGRLPISVANLGVREFTLIGLLSLYGVDAATAVFFSLLVFSNALVTAALGLVYQLLGALNGVSSSKR